MKLNYIYTPSADREATPIVLLHGLFGDLNNLGLLAREFKPSHSVLQVDLRNHGLSPWCAEMNYTALANDVLQLIQQLNLPPVTVIGHSMGGKTAMALTQRAPEQVDSLVVIDIAPVSYPSHNHEAVFHALQAVTASGVIQRRDAEGVMRQNLQEEATIQFLLKSFHQGKWRFNVDGLERAYANIIDWQEGPPFPGRVLFIKGGNSDYIEDHHRPAILRQFPLAQAHVVANSGHWVHGEKPQAVIRAIRRFMQGSIQTTG